MSNSSKFSKKHKLDANDNTDVQDFVQNGYVIYENVHDTKMIKRVFNFVMDRYNILLKLSEAGKFPKDIHGWAVAILDKLIMTELGVQLLESQGLISLMKRYLGPDIAILGQDALWINVPQDKNPVLSKGNHTDAWTGTSINTIFAKTLLTDVDEYNGMSVSPGSHLLGMVPVRNREIDPHAHVELESVNLTNLKQADVLIWHPLLIHATAGHSDKNIRISITSRYTSQETPFSSQERGLGYRPLSVSPLNQVLRLIGNDYLSPLRTYGGYVGIDRRLAKLYNQSNYEIEMDYSQFI